MDTHLDMISPSAPIIRADGLSKTFRVLKRKPGLVDAVKNLFSNDYEEVNAVDGISFETAPGELIGYIGPNGAGKSTTIKMLAGIPHPAGGPSSTCMYPCPYEAEPGDPCDLP